MKKLHPPKISIIMPVYNGAKFLDASISSVLKQTLADFELICVDDNSTDASVKKIKEYIEKDQRIKLYVKKNEGPGKALNFGINQAKGVFLCFLDQDDKYENSYLEKMYNEISSHETDLVLCYGKYFNSNNEHEQNPLNYPHFENKEYFIESLKQKKKFLHCFIPQWTKIVRKSFIKKNNISFPDKENKAHDYPFHALCLYFAKQITILPEQLYLHRQHNEQITNKVLSNSEYWRLKTFYNLHEYYKCYKVKNPMFMLFALEFIKGIKYFYWKKYYFKFIRQWYILISKLRGLKDVY